MKNIAEEKINLIMNILDGKLTNEELKIKITDMEKQYGSDVFRPYLFDKKGKPWTEEYYNNLREQALCGAGSKEFLLHVNEVRQEIVTQKKKKMTIIAVAGIILIVIMIILFI